MPRNKINMVHPPQGEHVYWEFSPHPSHSPIVQARILTELIKGGFITSLVGSKDPKDIAQFLDEKGISLHVNLGMQNDIKFKDSVDLGIFSSAFAFAFSSPERLGARHMSEPYMIKPCGSFSIKDRKDRFEIKALEVRDESVYRLLEEIQLMAGALFVYLEYFGPEGDVKKDFLLDQWINTRKEITDIFKRSKVNPDYVKNKTFARTMAEKTNISQELRSLITRRALEIKQGLKVIAMV